MDEVQLLVVLTDVRLFYLCRHVMVLGDINCSHQLIDVCDADDYCTPVCGGLYCMHVLFGFCRISLFFDACAWMQISFCSCHLFSFPCQLPACLHATVELTHNYLQMIVLSFFLHKSCRTRAVSPLLSQSERCLSLLVTVSMFRVCALWQLCKMCPFGYALFVLLLSIVLDLFQIVWSQQSTTVL